MFAGVPPARLRDRFDDGRHPPAQGRPDTHHRDYYLATDGSLGPDGGRLGAIVETIDGVRVGAWSRPVPVVDNNDAELKALHWGLDLLAERSPPDASIGILVDHELLGETVARVVGGPPWRFPEPPMRSSSRHHWRGILARVRGSGPMGVAIVPGEGNPAHAVATGRCPSSWTDRCVRVASAAQLRSVGGAANTARGSTDAT